MSSQFNNNTQSRYSPIEGECLTLHWAINKADYFLYGCDKLNVSVAMTVDRSREEIQSDELYKYIRQTIVGNVRISKFVGELSVYNYPKDILPVSPDGLIMYKGPRFLVPNVLTGLLRTIESIAFRSRRGCGYVAKTKGMFLVARVETGY